MGWTKPYQHAHYIGEHADDPTALAFIQALKWDSVGDGTGNPRAGMMYFDTGNAVMKAYTGSAWAAATISAVNANTALGYGALINAGGNNNIGVGIDAGYNADNNFGIFIGNYAGFTGANVLGANNLFLGHYAGGDGNAKGARNLFLGKYAGYNQGVVNDYFLLNNTAVALVNAATELTNSLMYGVFNAIVSNQMLRLNLSRLEVTDQNTNLMLGVDSGLGRNAGALYNIGIGDYTLDAGATFTGVYNIAIGYNAMTVNTTGYSNVTLGYGTLFANTTGYYNVALGQDALRDNISGYQNLAIGADCLRANTTGSTNVAIGYATLINNLTGNNNVGIGKYVLAANTSGYSNVGIGLEALYDNTTGYINLAIGGSALTNNTSGTYNMAFGQDSMLACTTGTFNSAIGSDALRALTTGERNIAIGYAALYKITTQVRNTAIGFYGLYNNRGSYNTSIGSYAGQNNITGSNLILIGYSAGIDETGSDKLFIHAFDEANEAAARTNSIIYGEMAQTDPANQHLYFNANVHLKHDSNTLYFGDNDEGQIFYGSGGDDALYIVQSAQDKDIYIKANDNGAEIYPFYVDASESNIGIMHTAPDYTLDVNGSVALREVSSTPGAPDEGALAIYNTDGTPANEYDGETRFRQQYGGNTYDGFIRKFNQKYIAGVAGNSGLGNVAILTIPDDTVVSTEVQIIGRGRTSGAAWNYEFRVLTARDDGAGLGEVNATQICGFQSGSAPVLGGAPSFAYAAGVVTVTVTGDVNNPGEIFDFEVKYYHNSLVTQA